ncbi:MAG TPA: T9SS type A sorting domain-containing protein, partial [bacterium]
YLVSNWGDGAIVQMTGTYEQSYFSTALQGQFQLAGLYIYGDTLLAAAGNAPNAGIAAFSLESSELLYFVVIPDIGLPNDIASDSAGNLFLTDYWGSRLFKIVNRVPSLYMDTGLDYPNGLMYDPRYHRLLVLSVAGPGAPILEVNLTDSTLSSLIPTYLATDGIAFDADFNLYVSDWNGDLVVKYDSSLANSSVFSSSHSDPADIYYDRIHGQLCVPNFSSHTVDFVPISPSGLPGDQAPDLPARFSLLSSHPNPFNASANIVFQLSQAAEISLAIYSPSGKLVSTLLNEWRLPGSHEVTFAAPNIASGIYFCHLRYDNISASRKLILLR